MTGYPALGMIIDGERVSGGGRRTHKVVNPATGETLAELPLADPADLDRALDTAARGFRIWRNSTPQQRAAVLQGAARLMLERQDELARIATMEEGKTIAEARIEVVMIVGLFNFYAGESFRLYGRTLVRPAGTRSTVTKEPVGPVAAFSPWNFPLGNPGRKLGAPIAAGCSVILKSAEETPASAIGVLQCLLDAGLPEASRAGGVRRARRGVAPPARLADHPQIELHRLDPGRQASDEARRRGHETDDDGAGRPRPGAGVRRCRCRPGARRHDAGQISQRRPGLRLADALHRPGGDFRSLPRRLCRARRPDRRR